MLRSVSEVLTALRIDQWDLLLLGDGSGLNHTIGAGWGCLLIQREYNARQMFYGACNVGTNTMSELMPYLHAFLWYHPEHGRRLLHDRCGQTIKVHIVTDNKAIAIASTKDRLTKNKSHRELWAVLETLKHRGYDITFHWVPRNQIDTHIFVDELSRQSRYALDNVFDTTVKKLKLPADFSAYSVCPISPTTPVLTPPPPETCSEAEA